MGPSFGGNVALQLALHHPDRFRAVIPVMEDAGAEEARGLVPALKEISDDMVCFTAPVLDSLNALIAGVAVSLPAGSVSDEDEARIGESVMAIARTMSLRIGADPGAGATADA